MRSDFYFKHLLAYSSGTVTAVSSHNTEVSVTTVQQERIDIRCTLMFNLPYWY